MLNLMLIKKARNESPCEEIEEVTRLIAISKLTIKATQ